MERDMSKEIMCLHRSVMNYWRTWLEISDGSVCDKADDQDNFCGAQTRSGVFSKLNWEYVSYREQSELVLQAGQVVDDECVNMQERSFCKETLQGQLDILKA